MTSPKERRANPESSNRDRRYVTRLSNPSMRDSAEQIRLLVMGLFWLFIGGAAGLLIEGIVVSSETLLRNAAIAIVAVLFATLLYSYAKALKSYIQLETPGTLALCFERQRNFWMLFSFVSVIAILSALLLNL